MAMTRAFGYVRLSKMDEATTSLDRQRRDIRAWCQRNGTTLVELFEDTDKSAYQRRVRRPDFERMLSRLGEVDVVVTWKLDRLARSVVGFNNLLTEFEAAGVAIATTDGAVDMTTASGRAMAQMTAVFAELEAATTSERVKAMHAFKKERGEWVGQVPFGWRRPAAGEESNGEGLVPVPGELAEIEVIARRYVEGESLRAIAATTRHTHTNLARILRSDRVLEALPADFASRLAIEMQERGRTGTTANPSLLGGICRCSTCDAPMTVTGSRRRADGRHWAAYSCREGHVSISKPWLDEHVSAAVLAAIDPRRLARRVERRRKPTKALQPAAVEVRLERLDTDFHELDAFPRERYLRLRAKLLDQLDEARASAEADAGPDIPLGLARRLREPGVWHAISVGERRLIVRALLRDIMVRPSSGFGKIDPSRIEFVWR
jgi:DNA invertase Pin-like site-specific DNA recombinase